MFYEHRDPAAGRSAPPDRRYMIYDNIRRKAGGFFEQWESRRRRLRTKKDFLTWQRRVRSKFLQALGPFPKKTPLNERVLGTLDYKNHRIEKVVFESRPGFFVTANLYIPKKSPLPAPAVLFASGHTDLGKAYELYHLCCLDLVEAGFVVFAFDPIGQGERISFKQSEVNFMVTNPCFEHDLFGHKLTLLGYNLAGIMQWDGIRALDYLRTRREVVKDKIACVGNSGGGTHTAYAMVADERLAAACPCCYITSREAWLELGMNWADAEQHQLGCISNGINHSDFPAAFAPKPVCVHAAKRDTFPIEGSRTSVRRAQSFYKALGDEKDCAIFEADVEHGLCKEFRENITRFLTYHLQGRRMKFRETAKAERPEKLRCLKSGNVRQLKGIGLADIIRNEAGMIKKKRGRSKAALAKNVQSLFKKEISCGFFEWEYRKTYGEHIYDVCRYNIKSEEDVTIPANMFLPKDELGNVMKRDKIFIFVGPQANSEGLRQHSVQRRLVEDGYVSLTADLRGWGDLRADMDLTGDGMYLSEDVYYEFFYMSLGESYMGNRLRDLLAVMKFVKARKKDHHLPQKLVIVGGGSGAWAASLAGLLGSNVKALVLYDFLPSYDLLFENTEYKIPLDIFTFGAYKAFDLPDVIGAFSPRKVVIKSAVDEMVRPIPSQRARKIFAGPHVTVTGGALSPSRLKGL